MGTGRFGVTRILQQICLLCAWTLLAACAPIAIKDTPGAGFVPERLERIDDAIEAAIEDGEIPGAVALIVRNGRTAYYEAFGLADIDSGTPMTTDSIFRIASMTKALTSVAVMILYEQGRFQLNGPVAKFLPAFGDMQVISTVDEDGKVTATTPASEPIRIAHLLAHTAGIAYPFIPSRLQKSYVDAGIINGLTTEPLTLAGQMDLLAEQPLLFEPGTEFHYGLNTDVLGRFVEVVSGQPLDEFFAEHITGPLAMDDTYFYLPADKAGRLVKLYAYEETRGLVPPNDVTADLTAGSENYPVSGAKTYFSGGAGLSSTAADYERFIRMLLNGGELDGTRILSRKSVELMSAPRADRDGDGIDDMGLGFRVVTDLGSYGELGSVGAYSWGGAFYTSYWIDPSENLTAVFMSQVYPARSSIASRFRTLVYQALD